MNCCYGLLPKLEFNPFDPVPKVNFPGGEFHALCGLRRVIKHQLVMRPFDILQNPVIHIIDLHLADFFPIINLPSSFFQNIPHRRQHFYALVFTEPRGQITTASVTLIQAQSLVRIDVVQ